MFRTLLTVLTLASTTVAAQSTLEDWRSDPGTPIVAQDIQLEDFLWQARPFVIFANSPLEPAFAEQLELLNAELSEVVERDIVIILDTDTKNPSDLRTQLRPRGFMWVLIGKDGQVKLRKPFPWDVRELSRVIDKMPIRKREIERE